MRRGDGLIACAGARRVGRGVGDVGRGRGAGRGGGQAAAAQVECDAEGVAYLDLVAVYEDLQVVLLVVAIL